MKIFIRYWASSLSFPTFSSSCQWFWLGRVHLRSSHTVVFEKWWCIGQLQFYQRDRLHFIYWLIYSGKRRNLRRDLEMLSQTHKPPAGAQASGVAQFDTEHQRGPSRPSRKVCTDSFSPDRRTRRNRSCFTFPSRQEDGSSALLPGFEGALPAAAAGPGLRPGRAGSGASLPHLAARQDQRGAGTEGSSSGWRGAGRDTVSRGRLLF